MAKTKQDYFNQGYSDFNNEVERNNKFTSGSWQENAYDSGYNQGIKERAVFNAAFKVSIMDEQDPILLRQKSTKAAVESHIKALKVQAGIVDSPRYTKLSNKISKLMQKHHKLLFSSN